MIIEGPRAITKAKDEIARLKRIIKDLKHHHTEPEEYKGMKSVLKDKIKLLQDHIHKIIRQNQHTCGSTKKVTRLYNN